jgi:hypothetical protein
VDGRHTGGHDDGETCTPAYFSAYGVEPGNDVRRRVPPDSIILERRLSHNSGIIRIPGIISGLVTALGFESFQFSGNGLSLLAI